MVRQQHQTLKEVRDGKLLTLNVIGQYLSYPESEVPERRKSKDSREGGTSSLAFDSFLFL